MKEPGRDAINRLKESWIDREEDLVKAAHKIGEFGTRYEASVSAIADILDTQAALIYVYMALTDLPDEIVKEIGKYKVPPSTWLLLRKLPDDKIMDAISRLDRLVPGDRPVTIVKEMVREQGDNRNDAILALPIGLFKHLGSKAKQYGILRPKDWYALVDIPGKAQRGFNLNQRQLGYLNGLLKELDDAGIIMRSCEKGKVCDYCKRLEEVLRASESDK